MSDTIEAIIIDGLFQILEAENKKLRAQLEKAVDMATLVSKYKAFNGDDWPAIQAKEFLAELEKENKK